MGIYISDNPIFQNLFQSVFILPPILCVSYILYKMYQRRLSGELLFKTVFSTIILYPFFTGILGALIFFLSQADYFQKEANNVKLQQEQSYDGYSDPN